MCRTSGLTTCEIDGFVTVLSHHRELGGRYREPGSSSGYGCAPDDLEPGAKRLCEAAGHQLRPMPSPRALATR